MKNLKSALTGKKLADLKSVDPTKGSNLIEPTKKEIGLILTALKEGVSHTEIKRDIRRATGSSKLGFSFDQIKKIALARLSKITELTLEPEVVEEVVKEVVEEEVVVEGK